MAPLQVIGAGFSRTGTDSLRVALNRLGYRTHHMKELHMKECDPTASNRFREAYLHPEEPVDWDSLYEGYDAACDVPTVCFLPRLLEKYPDAKVILTDRDPDSWYNSVKRTIYNFHQNVPESAPAYVKDAQNMAKIFLDGDFGTEKFLEDPDAMKAKLVKNSEWVKANVPADRLLVIKVGEGNYQDLCSFLGKDILDEPYPNGNNADDVINFIEDAYAGKASQ
ncbi:P-loop containing nucleoside triphosphate hydrolase protein [Syncephalastrum racemosum]|uniref:P-loop containing nucleoside triphosphate hydrolase protein n=1 Tax=Syncephalastrum racemosum TaxID=13706 RepID=A0A1X2HCA7_SYNRA|nr:P-loop containing nucleoside triphosphate hydrolase protein [Syncephalastrum racemosum]